MQTTEREVRIAEAVLDLAHRVADFDIMDLLHDLTEYALTLLTVECVGITVVDDQGWVQYATASDERCRELEEAQVDLGEGPCLDSARGSEPLASVTFGDDSPGAARWPRFTPHAREAGVIAIAAVPLRVHPDTTIGALNLMNTQLPVIPTADLRVAQALAGAAAACLLHQHRLGSQDEIGRQLQEALNSRVVIEQAKGVLSERLDLSMDQAFTRLRGHARSRKLTLTHLATEVAMGRGPAELNTA